LEQLALKESKVRPELLVRRGRRELREQLDLRVIPAQRVLQERKDLLVFLA